MLSLQFLLSESHTVAPPPPQLNKVATYNSLTGPNDKSVPVKPSSEKRGANLIKILSFPSLSDESLLVKSNTSA